MISHLIEDLKSEVDQQLNANRCRNLNELLGIDNKSV